MMRFSRLRCRPRQRWREKRLFRRLSRRHPDPRTHTRAHPPHLRPTLSFSRRRKGKILQDVRGSERGLPSDKRLTPFISDIRDRSRVILRTVVRSDIRLWRVISARCAGCGAARNERKAAFGNPQSSIKFTLKRLKTSKPPLK